jgi:hypothetical protein
MTAGQLICELEKMPQDAEVRHLWDGELRTAIEHVWLARSGVVVTADHDEVCYSNEARPESAPDSNTAQCWHSPKK